MLDLGVPRNVEPAARDLEHIRLHDLDDLEERCCPAAGAPSIGIAEAQRMIEDELARFEASLRARAVAPTLAQLHQLGEQLAREEADCALAGLGQLSARERQVIRDIAERLVRRVLFSLSRRFREAVPPAARSA
jgi:glutamyl-tRNA reductase